MGIIIRTLYNNQDWKAPCKTPGKDRNCFACFSPQVAIQSPLPTDDVCTGHCWEQHLCTNYRWGCTPKGRKYSYRAHPGVKVFFVFRGPDGLYTLWGKSVVSSVDDDIVTSGVEDEDGFSFIHFTPFVPLTSDKWVRNLKDYELVGTKWLMGRHRYIDLDAEVELEKRIEGATLEGQNEGATATMSKGSISLTIDVIPRIHEKLRRLSNEEGRPIDEIVREAIAEWLKGRVK